MHFASAGKRPFIKIHFRRILGDFIDRFIELVFQPVSRKAHHFPAMLSQIFIPAAVFDPLLGKIPVAIAFESQFVLGQGEIDRVRTAGILCLDFSFVFVANRVIKPAFQPAFCLQHPEVEAGEMPEAYLLHHIFEDHKREQD